MPVPEAVRITQELARAMAEAHENGLAHLRLSPKTVLRTDTGEVKILDLCLAAALTGTVSRDPLGTDLTAIGELAYAMLTGTRPQADPAPPSEFRAEIPPSSTRWCSAPWARPRPGSRTRPPPTSPRRWPSCRARATSRTCPRPRRPRRCGTSRPR